MIKVKVFEIVERYFDVEDEVFVNTSIGLPPFVNEDLAKEFCDRCKDPKFPRYYKLNQKFVKSGSWLSYQEKEVEFFESLEDYESKINQKANLKAQSDSAEDEME